MLVGFGRWLTYWERGPARACPLPGERGVGGEMQKQNRHVTAFGGIFWFGSFLLLVWWMPSTRVSPSSVMV